MQQGSYLLIEPGMQVHGTDGTLGTVAEVVADSGVDVFRGIVVSHGLLMPKKTLIVPDAIVSVTDQGVQVNLSREQAEHLPAMTSGVTPQGVGK